MDKLEVIDNPEQKTKESTDKEVELLKFLDKREKELKEARKNVFGQNIDVLMALADLDLQIKDTTEPKSKKVLRENETLGLRGTSTYVDLGIENWQSNVASIDPFIKVMTAISTLLDNDPRAVLTAGGTRYLATTEIQKQLYENSWKIGHSREQLKAFIYNLAKYGWAVARTHIKQETRKISEIIEYNPDTKEIKEEEKEIQNFAETIRKNLNPHKVWLDDKAKANDKESINDWIWEEDYGEDALEAEFGDTKNYKFIEKGGSPRDDKDKGVKDVYIVQFYENKYKDRFVVRVKCKLGWVILVNSPLPYDHKELSLWTTYWNMRHPETPYGVGIPEIMRGDKKLRNKVKNMTIDQVVLSILKMGIMEDTNAWGNRTRLEIKPGRIIKGGKVNWLEVPGPGQDAKFGLDFLQSEIDNATGITPTLEGTILGKTAFEIGQAKEAALKRLKLPLDNIVYALEIEAGLTIDLIYQAYTTPMVEHIVDQSVIDAYKAEVNQDPRFYFIETNKAGVGEFYAKRYKEISTNVEEKNGMFIPSGKRKFFYVMPDFIRWKGEIKIIAKSLLSTWKEVEKTQKLELTKLLMELLQLAPEIAARPAKQILEVWDENPDKWLPEQWIDFLAGNKKSPQQDMAHKGAEMLGAENLPPEMKQQMPNQIPEEEQAPAQKTGFMSRVGQGVKNLFGG